MKGTPIINRKNFKSPGGSKLCKMYVDYYAQDQKQTVSQAKISIDMIRHPMEYMSLWHSSHIAGRQRDIKKWNKLFPNKKI